MTDWTEKWTTDVSIRAAGVLCCVLAYMSAGSLSQLRHAAPAAQPGAIADGLAAIVFLGASFGTGLIALGRHIFDKIEVSDRWKVRPVISIPSVLEDGVEADLARAGGADPFARIVARTASPPIAQPVDRSLAWRGVDSITQGTSDLRIVDRW